MLTRGLIQIYTGNGKGKTTAALGLSLRAAGHGCRVLFCQFLKPRSLELGERKALARFPNVDLEILNCDWDMRTSLDDPAMRARVQTAAGAVLERLAEAAARRDYDLIVLDEIVFCLSHGLCPRQGLYCLLDDRDPHVEIVLTGRGADPDLIARADLVTEMTPIKHPYDRGIPARKAIEF